MERKRWKPKRIFDRSIENFRTLRSIFIWSDLPWGWKNQILWTCGTWDSEKNQETGRFGFKPYLLSFKAGGAVYQSDSGQSGSRDPARLYPWMPVLPGGKRVSPQQGKRFGFSEKICSWYAHIHRSWGNFIEFLKLQRLFSPGRADNLSDSGIWSKRAGEYFTSVFADWRFFIGCDASGTGCEKKQSDICSGGRLSANAGCDQ